MHTYIYIYTHTYIYIIIQVQMKTNAFQSNDPGIPDLCGFNDSFLPSFTIGFEEFSFYDGHWKVKCKARELELETTKNQMNPL